nr:unnamed protein product [Callosobruchus chinensis]
MDRRVSNSQLNALLDILQENPTLVRGVGLGPRSKEAIDQKWQEIANILNAHGSGSSKSDQHWKRVRKQRKVNHEWVIELEQKRIEAEQKMADAATIIANAATVIADACKMQAEASLKRENNLEMNHEWVIELEQKRIEAEQKMADAATIIANAATVIADACKMQAEASLKRENNLEREIYIVSLIKDQTETFNAQEGYDQLPSTSRDSFDITDWRARIDSHDLQPIENCDDSDSDEELTSASQNSNEKTPQNVVHVTADRYLKKTRPRNSNECKRKKAAIARSGGKEYIPQSGQVVQEKRISQKSYFSRKKIELIKQALKKGLNAPSPDQRGRHMNRPHKINESVIS